MGRRERPLDPDAGPVQAFAYALRELRREAGNPTYETMARQAFRSRSALSAAASGDYFPSLAVMVAYVTACGGDVAAWERRWHELHRRLSAEQGRAVPAPARVGSEPDGPRRTDPPLVVYPLLEQLAVATAAHWSREAEARGLHDPESLPVRWTATTGGSARMEGRFDEVGALFTGLACPRLVIVGPPGSGKTSLAVDLVGQLLDRRTHGQPVPVLLPIGTWNPATTHLRTWITARLEELYPALRAPAGFGGASLARHFTEGQLIVPVLDGLDEMPPAIRPRALPAINRALGRTAPLVLTCRADEYRLALTAAGGGPTEVAARPLTTATVVEPRPLEPGDVERYLTAALPPGQRERWGPVFAGLPDEPDAPLAQALSTPLMAGIARIDCTDPATDPAELLARQERGRAAVEDYLLDRFIHTVYPDRPDPTGRPCRWTAAQAEQWLRFLAAHLHRVGSRDLAWWQLYRAVPAGWFTVGFALIAAVTVAAPLALFGGLKGGAEHGLAGAVKDGLFGLMLGLAAALGLPPSGDPDRARRPARQLARATLGGVLGGGAYWVATIPADGVLRGLLFGLTDGAVVGVVVGLTAALADPYRPIHNRLRLPMPRRRVIGPMTVGLTFGVGMGTVAAAVAGGYEGMLSGLMVGVVSGLALAIRAALGVQTDVSQASSPAAIWRADRAAAIGHATVSAVLGGTTLGIVATLVTGPSVGIEFAVIYAMVYAVAAYSFTAGHSFLVARACLVAARRLPWPLAAFLDDAHRRGVLRQVGAVYQFRHARLQDRLATR